MGGTPLSPMPTAAQNYDLAPGGRIIHEIGVVRMGNDPQTSALNKFCQALDAKNVFVADGAPSVDVVGYSAGGVVVRLWVDDLGGGSLARRVVTLSSPHHGTEVAGLGADLGEEACPTACEQLAPDSDLLTTLNARDETPPGPRWVALWTTDDATVVPPTSGLLW